MTEAVTRLPIHAIWNSVHFGPAVALVTLGLVSGPCFAGDQRMSLKSELKHSFKPFFVILCLFSYSAGFAGSLTAPKCSIIFSEAKDLFRTIYRNKDFAISRPYTTYALTFGPDFLYILERLRADKVWADFGAATAWAQLVYEVMHPDHSMIPQMIATSIKRPPHEVDDIIDRTEKSLGNQFRYFEGKVEKMPSLKFPPIDLGTDMNGPMSWSLKPDRVLAKYLQVHKREGILFIGIDAQATLIETVHGTLTIDQWIGTIPGIKLTRYVGNETKEMGLKIEFLSKDIRVPKLKLIGLKNTIPPHRHFVEIVSDQ